MEPTGNGKFNSLLKEIESLPEDTRLALTGSAVECLKSVEREPQQIGKQSLIFVSISMAYLAGMREGKKK